MIVAMKDEVKDYRDNYHEAFKKLVYYYRISVVSLNCNLLNVLKVYILDGLDSMASMLPSILHVRGGRTHSYLFYSGIPTFLYMVADSLM